MNPCLNCTNAVSNNGTCLEVLGFDGHYTWGTPIHQDDVNQYPAYVMDSAQPPTITGNQVDCFAFSPVIPDADRFADDDSFTDEYLASQI